MLRKLWRRFRRPPAWAWFVVGILVVALLVWVMTKSLIAVLFLTPYLTLLFGAIWLGHSVWHNRVQIVTVRPEDPWTLGSVEEFVERSLNLSPEDRKRILRRALGEEDAPQK